jgi:hypothetical protein
VSGGGAGTVVSVVGTDEPGTLEPGTVEPGTLEAGMVADGSPTVVGVADGVVGGGVAARALGRS